MTTLLYNRSCGSLLQSSLRIGQLVSFAQEHGYHDIALCDRGVLYGAMEFWHLARQAGIHPIFGLEADVEIEQGLYPFLLFARTDQSYHQLILVSSRLQTSTEPVSLEQLVGMAPDCIIVVPNENGWITHLLALKQTDRITAFLSNWRHDGYFYVGLGGSDSQFNRDINPVLTGLCQACGVPTVALAPAFYRDPEDFESYKALLAIQKQVALDDPQLSYRSASHLRTPEQMQALFDPLSLQSTDRIAGDCQVTMDLPKAALPRFTTPQGVSSRSYLSQLCHAGLAKRFAGRTIPPVYPKRLAYELSVIAQMHFDDYFLIVWDFIRFSRQKGINTGVGRGSAAGSLVAYCLGITHIDPIRYGLLFERFLNPERISMPDIDTDFPDDRRQEVIDYVTDKYGPDHIAHIVAFATLAARQVLKDTGKVLGISASSLDIMTKAIPNEPKITLQRSYDENPRFRKAVESSAANRHLYQLALKLEGLPHHVSMHAAGLVMSDRELTDNVPLLRIDAQTCATQYPMEYLEELGLIKMDFLGLRNLTIIAQIVQAVNQVRQTPIDILKIPLDDAKTYELICSGCTTGIFQLESEGMRNLIRKLNPRCFDDIVVTIALFRPGPMENIPAYLAARQNPQSVVYPHPDLKPILQSTYGIMIYQEQIMQVAQLMAGFSLGKADLLRKAVSKKHADQLAAMHDEFITGALARGYDRRVAVTVFEMILKFTNYGFNKSHSVAYAMTAYQLAYLKANFPLPFYQALLNSVIGNDAKTAEYITEARQADITILGPDINASFSLFIAEDGRLRYPLLSLKGIGRLVSDQIVAERQANGAYPDYLAAVARMANVGIGPKALEILIQAGVLDSLGLNRPTMLKALPEALRYAELIRIGVDGGQASLDFGLVSPPIITPQPGDPAEDQRAEFEIIGMYLKGHPAAKLRNGFPSAVNSAIAKKTRGRCEVVVQVKRIREHRTVKGDLMCFATGYDDMGQLDLVFMPDAYQRYADQLKKDAFVYAQGTIDDRQSLKVSVMRLLTQGKEDAG